MLLVGAVVAGCASGGSADDAASPTPTPTRSPMSSRAPAASAPSGPSTTPGRTGPSDGSASPWASAPAEPGGRARAVVVVGPTPAAPPGEVAALAAAAERLPELLPGLGEVRVVQAESLAFAEELARTFVDDGAELVCLVGTGTGARAARLARDRPAARLCGTDAASGTVPPNLAVATHDRRLVARAAGAAAGPDAVRVAVLLPVTGAESEELVDAVATGVRPGATPTPSGAARPGPDPGPQVPVRAVPPTSERADPVLVDVLRRRPDLVLALTGGVDALVARTAAAAGVPSVGLTDWLVPEPGGALPAGVVVGIEVDRTAVLATAAAAALEGRGGVEVLGAEAGVLEARAGARRGAAAAADRARRVLRAGDG